MSKHIFSLPLHNLCNKTKPKAQVCLLFVNKFPFLIISGTPGLGVFLLLTHQYLCQDAVIIRLHGNHGLVGLNLTKGIACCHRLP